MALEEPTVSEMVRTIDARTARIEQGLTGLVSKEIYERDQKVIEGRLTALESKGRQWWTLFALPVMVGLFMWLIPQAVK